MKVAPPEDDRALAGPDITEQHTNYPTNAFSLTANAPAPHRDQLQAG
jgi:hypothetical protein